MDLFGKIFGRGPDAQQTAAAAPVTPTNNPTQNPAPAAPASSAVTAPNGTVPPDGNKPSEQSPHDKFSKLWDPAEPDQLKQGNQTPDNGLTPEKMLEAASKVDFRKTLNPELITKLQAGGTEAVEATLALMNQTAQQVYGQSVVVAQKLVDRAVEQATQEFAKQIPGLVKGQAARESLLSENPAFKDPKVAPIVGAVQQQLQLKHPQASAAEISQMAREYFRDAASVFSADPKAAAAAATANKVADGESWDDWFKLPTPSQP
jgi:uncharacterized protein (DUF924 family)